MIEGIKMHNGIYAYMGYDSTERCWSMVVHSVNGTKSKNGPWYSQEDMNRLHAVMSERATKFDALLEKAVACEKENKRLRCCGSCRYWELHNEYFECRNYENSCDNSDNSCQNPSYECENWEGEDEKEDS